MNLKAQLGLVNIAFIEFSHKLNTLLEEVETLSPEDERTLLFAMEDVRDVLGSLDTIVEVSN